MENITPSANGNARKLLTLCVAIAVGINTPTYLILREHWGMLDKLENRLEIKTVDRYYRKDAEAHLALETEKLNNIRYRLDQNELNIRTCLDFMDRHHRLDEDFHHQKAQ